MTKEHILKQTQNKKEIDFLFLASSLQRLLPEIIPALKRAAASHDGNRNWKRFKMWHDNEAFLKQPLEYPKAG